MTSMKHSVRKSGGLLFLVASLACSATAANRPNILWIVLDDVSAHFSCYGETTIQTPNLDRLAREGARLSPPVCSPYWPDTTKQSVKQKGKRE